SIWSCDTHSSFSSLQLGSCRGEERCFTPESPALFPLSRSSLMCEGFDLSAGARELERSSVILEFESLYKEKENICFLYVCLSACKCVCVCVCVCVRQMEGLCKQGRMSLR